MTLQERLAEIAAIPGVLAADAGMNPQRDGSLPGDLRLGQIKYTIAEGNVATTVDVILVVVDYGLQTEAAYWHRGIPVHLVPAPAAPSYFSARSGTAITAQNIKDFCNATWAQLHAGAPSIRSFSVEPVDGSTVRIHGDFCTAPGGTWTNAVYYVRLVDPNGSVAVGNSNIKFEQVIQA